MSQNPLEEDPAREERVKVCAYHLWEDDGQPIGRELEFWERARELVAMRDSVGAGQMLPDDVPRVGPSGQIIEEADIQENLGEFPDRLSDQGEHRQTPSRKNVDGA